MHLTGNCWPNEEQMLLLKAALSEPTVALAAWEEWAGKIDIANADVFSYQIMPQIYHHLHQNHKKFTHQGILKGIYKHTWMNNQLLMNHLAKILSSYYAQRQRYQTSESVVVHPILLMKGGAMLQGFYDHWGCRVIGDFDLLIPLAELKSFIGFLMDQGLTTSEPDSIARIEQNSWQMPKNSIPFQDKSCDRPFFLDLHVTPLTEMFTGDQFETVWFERFRTHEYHYHTIDTLSPTDLLFQTIIHGTKYCPVPLFRWIMDATTILRQSMTDICWDQVYEACSQYDLTLQINQAIYFLKKYFVSEISDEIISRLQALHVSQFNRDEFERKAQKVSSFRQVWIHHRFHARRQKKSMVRFVKDYWNVASYYELPSVAIRKTYAFIMRNYFDY